MSRKTRKLLETMRDFSANEIAEVKGILIDNELRALRAEFEKLKNQLAKRIISVNRRVNMAENRIKRLRKIRGRKR